MPTNTGQRAASTAVILALMAGVLAMPAYAQRYSAVQHDDVVTLTDRETDTVVTVVPSVGNIATEMRVKGHNVLRYPHASLAEFRERPGATGIPFMGPWINRLDEQAFYANGRRHAFDMSLGNVRGEVPIHGFVTGTNLWRVVSVEGDPASPISEGHLCPKGAATEELLTHAARVTRVKYRAPFATAWTELDLDTAMDMVAARVWASRERHFEESRVEQGSTRPLMQCRSIAHLGGATLDNEENYLIKKLFCGGLGIVAISNQARI